MYATDALRPRPSAWLHPRADSDCVPVPESGSLPSGSFWARRWAEVGAGLAGSGDTCRHVREGDPEEQERCYQGVRARRFRVTQQAAGGRPSTQEDVPVWGLTPNSALPWQGRRKGGGAGCDAGMADAKDDIYDVMSSLSQFCCSTQ